jgi:hypothetical protein
VKASSAPNAKIPAMNSTSAERASPNATSEASVIVTYGVDRRGWRRPTRLGICRFVASE